MLRRFNVQEFHLEVRGHGLTPDLGEKLYEALLVFLALFPNLSKLRLSSAGLGKPSGEYWQSLRERCLKLRTVRFNSDDEASLNDMLE